MITLKNIPLIEQVCAGDAPMVTPESSEKWKLLICKALEKAGRTNCYKKAVAASRLQIIYG
jgi:hypothetical protein